MHGATSRSKTFLCRGVTECDSLISFRITGEQHTGFFKTFTNCRHPIGETTIWNLQNCARFKVIEPVAKRLKCLGAVGRIDFAPRKHIHTTGKCRIVSALQHKHFETVSHIANQHHSCRRSQGTLVFGHRLIVVARTCHDKIVRPVRTANRIENMVGSSAVRR